MPDDADLPAEDGPAPDTDGDGGPHTADALDGPDPVLRTAHRVRSRWIIGLLSFVVLAAAGVALVATQPVEYQSTAVLAFQPTAGQPVGADLVTLLAERYPELVSSQESVDAAAAAAGVSPSQVTRGLSAAITPLTLNLVISVRLPTATQAQEATTSLARQVAIEDASDPYLTSVVVAAPSLPDRPAGLPKIMLYGLAVATAAVLAVVITAIVAALRPRHHAARARR